MNCLSNIKHYRVTSLPSNLTPNAIYYVLVGEEVEEYIVDNEGIARRVGGQAGSGGGTISAGSSSIALGQVIFSNANSVTFGLNGSTLTASVSAGNPIFLSNSNGVTFGSMGSVVTASISASQVTDYISTNQSSLFQQTSLMSDYLNTNYTTHTHSQYLNTSQSSLFQQTSQMTDYLGTDYTSHTHSQYLNTSQSSLFRHTSNDSQLQFTSQMSDYALTDHTHSQYINTSQSSLFQHTSATSAITSNALNTSQSSLFRHTSADSQLQFTSQMSDYLGTTYTTHTHPAQTGLSAIILSNTTYTSGTISLRDGNGVSWASTTGQGISLVHELQYSSNTSLITSNALNTSQSSLFQQTSQMTDYLGTNYTTHTHTQLGQALSGSNGSFSFETATFGNLNGLSFYTSNGSMVGSYTVPTQTNQTVGLYASSNTTLTSSGTVDARSMSFRGIGIVSVGVSASEVILSATQSNQAFSAGAASSTFQTLSLQDSNGISFSNNAGAVRLTHDLQYTSATSAITSNALNTSQSSLFQHTSATSAITSAAVHTSAARIQGIIGSNTTYTSGSVGFRDLNGISWQSTTGQSFQITHALQFTSNTSDITSNALNTSQSSLFQHTSATSAITSNALHSSASRVINIIAATNSTGGGTASLSSNVSFSNTHNFTFFTSAGNAIVASFNNTALAGSGFTSAGNNIGLSGTLNSAGLSLSATVAAQTNQTLGIYASSNTTLTSSGTIDARSLSVRGIGNISVGYSANEVVLSVGAGGGGAAISAGANSQSTGTVNFANSNGITFGLSNNGTMTASHNGITSQTNQTIGGYFLGNTTGQSSSSTWDARTVSFEGAGIVSVGASAGSIRISATQSTGAFSAAGGSSTFDTIFFRNNAQASFTNSGGALEITSIKASIYAIGNTTQSSSNTMNLDNFSINGGGIVSIGASNGSVLVSATQSNQAASASNGSFTFQTLNFSNANNVTFGTSAGGIVTASVAAPGAAAENNWHHLLGANTAGNTTASGSTIGLSGINLTLSGTNASVINISAPATSSLSATGQVSISTNGSTISIGVPNAYTNSGLNVYADTPYVFSTNQASLMIDPNELPNVQFDRVGFLLNNTNSSNSSGSHTLSFWFGLYTRTGSTLSLLTSVSSSTNITHSGTAGSYSLYSGARLFTIGLTNTLTEGKYWFGFLSRTTSGGANGSYSVAMISQLNSNFLGHFGSSHNTTYQYNLGKGVYATTTSGLPNSIGFNQIRGSDLAVLRPAVIQLISSTV